MSQHGKAPQQNGLKNKLWFNVLMMIVVCIALFVLFFSSLGIITNHGEEAKVPNVTGKQINDAMKSLTDMGFEVKVDSTYEPSRKPFVVLQQMPEVGEVVKIGRTLFLTVNKANPPETAMPKLVDLTFRSAELVLQSNRLVLGDTMMRPDIGKGLVLQQLFNGQPITPGTMIPQGSVITLVVGDGLGNTEMDVPDVMGQPYAVAIASLSSTNFLITTIPDAGSTDTANWVVYRQDPEPMSPLGVPARIREGNAIDIYVSENPSDTVINYWRNHWQEMREASPDSTN